MRRWRVLSRLCPGVFLNMPDLKMTFVRHETEIVYVRRMHGILRMELSSESDVVNLSCRCMPRPFSSLYLKREVDTWGQELVLKVRQRLKGLRVGWHNIKLFTVSPARREPVYAALPGFWYGLENLRWFLVATLLYFSYF